MYFVLEVEQRSFEVKVSPRALSMLGSDERKWRRIASRTIRMEIARSPWRFEDTNALYELAFLELSGGNLIRRVGLVTR